MGYKSCLLASLHAQPDNSPTLHGSTNDEHARASTIVPAQHIHGQQLAVGLLLAAHSASAVLNTGGNLGGVVATPAIAALSEHHQWQAIFALGAATSVGAAVLWFWVDVAHAGGNSREMQA